MDGSVHCLTFKDTMKRFQKNAAVMGGCVLLVLNLATSTRAGLLAYEPFDYTAGSALTGQTGGFGFSDAWSTSAGTAIIQAPGMNYPGLPTLGGTLYIEGTAGASPNGSVAIFRTLASPRGDDGTTTWISFLHIRTGQKSGTFGPDGGPSYLRPVNFSLFNSTLASGQERLAIGEGTRNTGATLPDTDVWGLVERGGVNNPLTSWTTAPLDVESWAVVRIDHGADNLDTAWLWVNPGTDSEPSIATAMATMTGIDLAFNRIRPFAGNPTTQSENIGAQGLMDEIRIGTTWADMLLVPEPSSLSLLAVGGLALLLRRRTKA